MLALFPAILTRSNSLRKRVEDYNLEIIPGYIKEQRLCCHSWVVGYLVTAPLHSGMQFWRSTVKSRWESSSNTWMTGNTTVECHYIGFKILLLLFFLPQLGNDWVTLNRTFSCGSISGPFSGIPSIWHECNGFVSVVYQLCIWLLLKKLYLLVYDKLGLPCKCKIHSTHTRRRIGGCYHHLMFEEALSKLLAW